MSSHAHHDHDHAHGHEPPHPQPPQHACCSAAACEAPPAPAATAPGDVVLHIPAMDCAAEEAEIRRALDPLAGIRSLRFELGARRLHLSGAATLEGPVIEALRRAGFESTPVRAAEAGAAPGSQAHGGSEGLPRLLLALGLAILAEVLAFFAPETRPFEIATLGVAGAAIGLAGFSTYRKGLAALRVGRLNINALMTVAVTGAFLIGEWPEAAMVMALYAIAELIEARAVDRARNAISSLMKLAPEEAEVRGADGAWQRKLAKQVAVGEVFRVKPGERMPLDGVVVAGNGAVDQASVTGESVPVDKGPGDEVYAGTINAAAALEVRATAPASDTLLARIIRAVEEAQGSRAPTQRFVDRFSAVYTPAIFVLALAVAVLAPWLAGWTWMQALYKALVLLVIACPCALVISTPVTVVSGLAAAARRGVLVKGGAYLEEARKLRAVALDKTGTITEGRPVLVAFEAIDARGDEAQLRSWARSLASRSDHPVSKAIAAGLPDALDLGNDLVDFEALPGRGVTARLQSRRLTLANHRWVEEAGLCSPALEARLAGHEQQGRSLSLLADERGVLALVAVADRIKPSSREAVEELKALGIVPVMLTGDNALTAKAIGAQAGISEVRGPLLPDEKLVAITELQARHGLTAMTGDGINDAPALAKADIGFAMGGAGTHTAMEAADVVVMNDDLRRLPELVRLSRRTFAVLAQNIGLALSIKLIFLVLALVGNASMWMAVFADMGASLLVVFNGLRLLRQRQ